MNNDSPISTPGSFLEQKNKGRSRVRIAVFVILAIHGVGLLALLAQGCKQDNKQSASDAAQPTNAAPAFVEPSNAPPLATTNAEPSNAAPVQATVPIAPPAAPQDYNIAAGDSFSTLAKRFSVSTRAIMDANPGVEPTKLQIGQKIHIPAQSPIMSTAAAPQAPADTNAGASQSYTVKSGDTLIAIAREFGVRVRALRSANNLASDRIVVGQKLKIPSKTATAESDSAPGSGLASNAAAPQH